MDTREMHDDQRNRVTAQTQLLKEGLHSYRDALISLGAFQDLIQKICSDVLIDGWSEFTHAATVLISSDVDGSPDLELYVNPAKTEDLVQGEWSGIGSAAKIGDTARVLLWIEWSADDHGHTQVYAGFGPEFIGAERYHQLQDLVDQTNTPITCEDDESICLHRPLMEDQEPVSVEDLRSQLLKLVTQWCSEWNKLDVPSAL